MIIYFLAVSKWTFRLSHPNKFKRKSFSHVGELLRSRNSNWYRSYFWWWDSHSACWWFHCIIKQICVVFTLYCSINCWKSINKCCFNSCLLIFKGSHKPGILQKSTAFDSTIHEGQDSDSLSTRIKPPPYYENIDHQMATDVQALNLKSTQLQPLDDHQFGSEEASSTWSYDTEIDKAFQCALSDGNYSFVSITYFKSSNCAYTPRPIKQK